MQKTHGAQRGKIIFLGVAGDAAQVEILVRASRGTVAYFVPAHSTCFDRRVAQLVEHWSPKPAAVGSSPTSPAKTCWVGKEILHGLVDLFFSPFIALTAWTVVWQICAILINYIH